jgi:benzoate/toluate 1,2-dioxygenase reductase subunit
MPCREKVLDAAYRQKVNLPMDCSDGVCGTCKCHCASGEYDLGEDYLDEALSDDEAQARQVLTCQMVPTSDCVIDVPVAAAQCKTALTTGAQGATGELSVRYRHRTGGRPG